MINRLPILWKVTILTFGVVLLSLLIAGIALIGNFLNLKEADLANKTMMTARTIAQLPEIKRSVGIETGISNINPIVEKIRIINGVDYIVVLNMEGIRLSHPLTDRVGEVFEGEDAAPAFAEHIFTSKAKGELGYSIRSFVPIMNDDLEQIGVVMVGIILPTALDIILDLNYVIIITFALSIIFGLWGSWLFAQHIKGQLNNLEPYEIARLLNERNATFNALNEGVIAIDIDRKITFLNDKAKQMLGQNDQLIGQPVDDVIPATYMSEVLNTNEPIYNRELLLGTTLVVSSIIPIRNHQTTIGAVGVFQDRTEMKKLAEELTGVKMLVETLRVQNHEHRNKMHTITGLLQLKESEKALDYIFHTTEHLEHLTSMLSKRINDPSLSGLLLGKYTRGKELSIRVIIDPRSYFRQFPLHIDDHDMVVIIGNLIENAFDSLQQTDIELKEVYISIDQDHEGLSIMIEDNGPGFIDEISQKIFEKGFTTKGEQRGLGLNLVHRIVMKGNGTIHVQSVPFERTSFIIWFPIDILEGDNNE